MARPTYEQLAKLSYVELKAVDADLQNLIKEAEAQARQDARAKLLEQAQELGFSIPDLFGNAAPAASKGRAKGGSSEPSQAKYRHPENPELTWSGRGRQPAWIKEHEGKGGSKEDFLITD